MASKTNEDQTPKIFRKSKGQIVVEGKVKLTDLKGNPIKHGNRFTLCGCTKSKNMPFCDGSHKV
ncbi:MAG: CDGSH iron-sulfur domain-containing protein [Bacteroidota bacterium]|nr:CDGSH iron-sulfur domain-containing protein [Bacteroidota bacterium]